MKPTMLICAALALFGALPAHAEQYAVQFDRPFKGATPGLLKTLGVTELDNFDAGGRSYMILDAPGAAYVEAYVFAIRRKAREVNELDADWTHPGLSELTVEHRLRFLRQMACDYCSS